MNLFVHVPKDPLQYVKVPLGVRGPPFEEHCAKGLNGRKYIVKSRKTLSSPVLPPGSYNEYQFVVSKSTVEYQVKELLPHTEYTFYMVAYSLLGASSPSNSMTVKMLEDGELHIEI